MGKKKGAGTLMEQFRAAAGKWKLLLNRRNQTIFFLLTLLFVALSLLDVFLEMFPMPVSIAVYVCAAVCFFPSCTLWGRAVYLMFRMVLIPFTHRDQRIQALVGDYRLLTVVFSLPGLGMGLIFAVFNAVIGITSQSPWHGSLAAYYILLCAMRLVSVLYAKSVYMDKQHEGQEVRELKVYRTCGILLAVMSIALVGAVILLVTGTGGKTYPGLLIYAAAAYTFYKLAMSAISMARARRERSPLAMTFRYVGHSEALVSLLSLQTALFAQFGQGAGALVPIMNAATGAAVCLAALTIGLYMVWDAGRKLRALSQNRSETGGTIE